MLSKGRQELYLTWISNQSRHLLTQALETPQLTTMSVDHSDFTEMQTAFEALQEVTRGSDQESPQSGQLEVLSTSPNFPWPPSAPEGFGPR